MGTRNRTLAVRPKYATSTKRIASELSRGIQRRLPGSTGLSDASGYWPWRKGVPQEADRHKKQSTISEPSTADGNWRRSLFVSMDMRGVSFSSSFEAGYRYAKRECDTLWVPHRDGNSAHRTFLDVGRALRKDVGETNVNYSGNR